jgi:uncharacterized protein YqjF (DUF2071 family)
MTASLAAAGPSLVSSPPPGRVFLATRWQALAMINFEIEPRLLEPYVPRGTELDFFDGRTYISLVGFTYHDTRVLGWSIPWHRHFPEVNLRFYVRRVEGGEVRRAVVFIREIVPRPAVAAIARLCYSEAFVTAPMRHEWQGVHLAGDQVEGESPRVRYGWRYRGQWLGIGVDCRGHAQPLIAGSQEAFIAEHYWGYSRHWNGGTLEYRVEHAPWRVWAGAEPLLEDAVADFYPAPFADVLRQPASSAFLADGSAVQVYRPVRIA